jgi:Activator of Hsp90 ATPase homolog 1-like protein
MSYSWNQFTRRISVKAAAKSIYDAWATQQGLESWFLRQALFIKQDGNVRTRQTAAEKGDRYQWLWYGYDDTVKEEREILEANGWDRIQFQFSGGCIVTVSIRQEAGETICELVQDMPMDDLKEQQYFFIECGKGWDFYLTNLKSVLEGGLDLRNKNPGLKDMVNA